jgi:hypothetical protein
MKQTTRPHRMLPCLLLLIALSPSPIMAQQAPVADSTVLPPPSGDESAPAPTLGPSIPIPNTGPFATPPPAPPPAAENLWGLIPDWSFLQRTFGDHELDIMKPHLKAALIGPAVFPGGITTSVHPPTTPLNWAAVPRWEIGWFLPPGCGYLAISWRGFADDGRQTVTAQDAVPYDLRTRLDLNQFAFDYGTIPYSFSPRWFMSGRIGMAAADVYFDNVAVSAPQTLDASNDYWGAGPHLRLDVWREFNLLPGLALFAQPDLMVLVGRIQQHYRESDLIYGSTIAGSYFLRRTQTVPVFTVRAGLSYTPPNWNQWRFIDWSKWRFMIGYEFENWWNVGQVPGQPSRGEFYTNGVFLRAVAAF